METLKRDWDSKLTLRDVLVTISCLLIQPNPDSALNAEAGALIQENYDAFAERAKLMTSIQAPILQGLAEGVRGAQRRGQEDLIDGEKDKVDQDEAFQAPAKRRRTARQTGTATSRRSDGSPTAAPLRRRRHYHASNPFLVQAGHDDVFETADSLLAPTHQDDDDSSMADENQENDEARSPSKPAAPRVAAPRRPLGPAVPLGELTLEDSSSNFDEDTEPEYPPSPRKSPIKSPSEQRARSPVSSGMYDVPESSQAAAARGRNITPANIFSKPLAQDSPFVDSSALEDQPMTSPRKQNRSIFTPGPVRASPVPTFGPWRGNGGIFKNRPPSSSEKKRDEAKREEELAAKLWDLCGRHVARWNRGDFDGEPFSMKAKRW